MKTSLKEDKIHSNHRQNSCLLCS